MCLLVYKRRPFSLWRGCNVGSRAELIDTFDAEGSQWWGRAELIWFYSVIGIFVLYRADAIDIAT